MLEQVISGGQTGVDQAGLRAAKQGGYRTGGWVPKGCRTEAGPAPWLLTEYGCIEHPSPAYAPRTVANVRMANATLILGWPGSPGCNLTWQTCGRLDVPRKWIRIDQVCPQMLGLPADPVLEDARRWLHQFRVVNVAGNREESYPGIGAWAESLLGEILLPF